MSNYEDSSFFRELIEALNDSSILLSSRLNWKHFQSRPGPGIIDPWARAVKTALYNEGDRRVVNWFLGSSSPFPVGSASVRVGHVLAIVAMRLVSDGQWNPDLDRNLESANVDRASVLHAALVFSKVSGLPKAAFATPQLEMFLSGEGARRDVSSPLSNLITHLAQEGLATESRLLASIWEVVDSASDCPIALDTLLFCLVGLRSTSAVSAVGLSSIFDWFANQSSFER